MMVQILIICLVRLDGGLGKRDMVNDAADTNYRSCSELRLDGGLGSSHGEHSLRGDLISVHM